MTSQPMFPAPVGQVFEISFVTFTPPITIHDSRWPDRAFLAGTHRKHDRARA